MTFTCDEAYQSAMTEFERLTRDSSEFQKILANDSFEFYATIGGYPKSFVLKKTGDSNYKIESKY